MTEIEIRIATWKEAEVIAETEMNRQIDMAKAALCKVEVRLGHPQLCADIILGRLKSERMKLERLNAR